MNTGAALRPHPYTNAEKLITLAQNLHPGAVMMPDYKTDEESLRVIAKNLHSNAVLTSHPQTTPSKLQLLATTYQPRLMMKFDQPLCHDRSMQVDELHAAHTLTQLSGNHTLFSTFSQIDNRGPFHTSKSDKKLFSEIDCSQSSRSVLSIKRPRQK